MKSPAWKIALLFPALLGAADLSSYRGFTFGSDIATISKQIGVKPEDAIVMHRRPALLQDLKWQIRPPLAVTGDSGPADPVESIVFSFLDGKLYKIVARYDRYKVKGLTVADFVGVMFASFGFAQFPNSDVAFHTYYGEREKVLAQWLDRDFSFNLINTGDPDSFALLAFAAQQEAVAQAAILEASRLDALDAPRRAQEAEAKRLEGERLTLEKTRAMNKSSFRP